MGLRDWLQARRKEPRPEENTLEAAPSVPVATTQTPTEPQSTWEALEPYVPVDPAEATLPAVIATAIAAGDHPKSEFKVTSVKVANPEYQTVSVIATSIAAGDRPESSFVVKRIYKQKQEEENAS